MEFIMKNISYMPLSVLALAMISACSTAPNPSLTAAHSSYDAARNDANIVTLAAPELKDASDSLNKADRAFKENAAPETVNHFAYLTKQQVDIAEETAKRKLAEAEVNASAAKRTQVQLDARTAEADAAHALVAKLRALNAQKN